MNGGKPLLWRALGVTLTVSAVACNGETVPPSGATPRSASEAVASPVRVAAAPAPVDEGPVVGVLVYKPPPPPPPPPPPVLPRIRDRLEAAGARDGEITVTLAWDDGCDLDLRVIPPCGPGSTIYFNNKRACKGTLDVDMNFGSRHSRTPVEHVVWPFGEAPEGDYAVSVSHAGGRCTNARTDFQVIVSRHGREETFGGSVNRSGTAEVTRFAWP